MWCQQCAELGRQRDNECNPRHDKDVVERNKVVKEKQQGARSRVALPSLAPDPA